MNDKFFDKTFWQILLAQLFALLCMGIVLFFIVAPQVEKKIETKVDQVQETFKQGVSDMKKSIDNFNVFGKKNPAK